MKWIPVSERLPELKEPVLVYDREEGFALAWRWNDSKRNRSGWTGSQPCWGQECDPMLYDVTHWTPLEPPEEV